MSEKAGPPSGKAGLDRPDEDWPPRDRKGEMFRSSSTSQHPEMVLNQKLDTAASTSCCLGIHVSTSGFSVAQVERLRHRGLHSGLPSAEDASGIRVEDASRWPPVASVRHPGGRSSEYSMRASGSLEPKNCIQSRTNSRRDDREAAGMPNLFR